MVKPELAPTRAKGLTVSDRGDEVEFRSKWLRLVVSRQSGRITELCWDSLGEGKVDANLLKPGPDGGAGASFSPLFPDRPAGVCVGANRLPTHSLVEIDGNVVRCGGRLADGVGVSWELRIDEKAARVVVRWTLGRDATVRTPPGLRFAFDVSKTPVAPLANPRPGVTAPLPCILHAADYGSLLLQDAGPGHGCPRPSDGRGCPGPSVEGQSLRQIAQWNAFVVGAARRGQDGLYALLEGTSRMELRLSVESAAPVPELVARDPRLRGLARHWLNTFQYRPDIGILANNIVSDNCVFCMHTFADAAVFTPTLPGGIEAIDMVRESLDRYLGGATGYGIGWEEIMTEVYPSLVIAAWDVIRVTGDRATLRRWLPKLESFAAKIEVQDRNGNGLPESVKPGTPGEIHCPTGNWWDQINFGHEDAYVSALAYRAWRCLADLERLAGAPAKAARYERNAGRLKSAYLPTFMNPKTGILAGWKDANDTLHDYWFVFVNGIAIVNGLVPDDQANTIVDRIEAKMREVGYNRFDLGLPGNLVPIPKCDYGLGALGSPQKDDGTDTFGVFENGGATACYAYYYLQALYKLGRRAEADRILWPMMKTYAEGGFQSGVGKGGEWRHWDGRPSGYEGFLSDAYLSQLAVLTGHYGISFGADGFRFEPWSPLKGRPLPAGLRYMGRPAQGRLSDRNPQIADPVAVGQDAP